MQFGETIELSNMYCFDDDRVFIVLETNISLNNDDTSNEEEKINTLITQNHDFLSLPELEEDEMSSKESLSNSHQKGFDTTMVSSFNSKSLRLN